MNRQEGYYWVKPFGWPKMIVCEWAKINPSEYLAESFGANVNTKAPFFWKWEDYFRDDSSFEEINENRLPTSDEMEEGINRVSEMLDKTIDTNNFFIINTLPINKHYEQTKVYVKCVNKDGKTWSELTELEKAIAKINSGIKPLSEVNLQENAELSPDPILKEFAALCGMKPKREILLYEIKDCVLKKAIDSQITHLNFFKRFIYKLYIKASLNSKGIEIHK